MDVTNAESPVETESEREMVGKHFYDIKKHFLASKQAPKDFIAKINRGRWEGCNFDVRLVILGGELEPRWCALEWYKNPDFLPELGDLPYAFYVHEEKDCLKEGCGWTGTTQRRGCPICNGRLSEGRFAELDGRFVANVHQDYEHKEANPIGVLRRAREAAKARRDQLSNERKERRAEAKERVVHGLGNAGVDFGRLRKPMISVPDAPRIIIPGR